MIHQPTDVGNVTDEEIFDDNELLCEDPNELQEVAGYVEVVTSVDVECADEEDTEDDVNDPGPSLPKKILRDPASNYKRLAEFGQPKWCKEKRNSKEVVDFDIQPNHTPLEQMQIDIVTRLENATPLELFHEFYDAEVLDLLVTETNR